MKKFLNYFYVIIFGTILFSSVALSQTIISVPSQYSTIQAAIAVAKAGNIVVVSPGQVYNVPNHLAVINGVTLRLLAGVEAHFVVGLTIDKGGIFETTGTETQMVYLLFGNNTGCLDAYGKVDCKYTIFAGMSNSPWLGVKLWGIGTSGSIFSWCEIRDVFVPYINSATAALVIHETHSVYVEYCKIVNLNVSPNYWHTTAIYIHNSKDIHVYKNLIKNNESGIVCNVESYVYFGKSGLTLGCNITNINGVGTGDGNNIITGNSNDGIHANNNSYMNLLAPSNNYNVILGNAGWDAVVWGTSTIAAIGNCWGANPPTNIYAPPGNIITWDPVLPCTPAPPRLSVGTIIEENNPITMIPQLKRVPNGVSSADELLETAVELLILQKHIEALDIFKLIVSNYKDNECVYGHALVGISGICKMIEDKELLEYLKAESKDEKALPIAKLVYASTLSGLGYRDEAISEYEKIAKSYPGTNHEINALVEISYIYIHKKDFDKTAEILKKLEKIAKEDDISVRFLRGMWYSEVMINDGRDDADKALEVAVDLLQLKDYRVALDIFKLIVSNYRDNERVYGHALVAISYIFEVMYGSEDKEDKELSEELLGYIKDHIEDALPVTWRVYAGTLSGMGYLNEDYYYKAISVYEEIIKKYPNTENEKIALYQIYNIYVRYLKIPEKVDETSKRIDALLNNTLSIDKPTELPTEYSLLQNYPNPFNPTTTIQYSIPKDEYVKLVIYDVTGKVVAELVNGYKSAGRYNVEFNASGYASGIYYYKIEAGMYKSVQKMMLIK